MQEVHAFATYFTWFVRVVNLGHVGDLNRSDIFIYIYKIELIRWWDVPRDFCALLQFNKLETVRAEFLQIKSICRGGETSQGFPHLGLSFFVLFPQDLTNKPLEHTPHSHKWRFPSWSPGGMFQRFVNWILDFPHTKTGELQTPGLGHAGALYRARPSTLGCCRRGQGWCYHLATFSKGF